MERRYGPAPRHDPPPPARRLHRLRTQQRDHPEQHRAAVFGDGAVVALVVVDRGGERGGRGAPRAAPAQRRGADRATGGPRRRAGDSEDRQRHDQHPDVGAGAARGAPRPPRSPPRSTTTSATTAPSPNTAARCCSGWSRCCVRDGAVVALVVVGDRRDGARRGPARADQAQHRRADRAARRARRSAAPRPAAGSRASACWPARSGARWSRCGWRWGRTSARSGAI